MKEYRKIFKKQSLEETTISITNKVTAGKAITEGIRYLKATKNISIVQEYLIQAIINGLKSETDDENSIKISKRIARMVIQELKQVDDFV